MNVVHSPENFPDPNTSLTNTTLDNRLVPVASRLTESARAKAGERVNIMYDIPHEPMAYQVAEELSAIGAIPNLVSRDLDRMVAIAETLPYDKIHELLATEVNATKNCDRMIMLRGAKNPLALSQLDPLRRKAFDEANSKIIESRIKAEIPSIVTLPPTEYEAKLEGLTLDEYIDIYCKACDQPWKEIALAQEILIDKLDKASSLTFRANSMDPCKENRTDLSMSIEGMTFVNSTVAKNFPGSEVFSAPVINSVQGTLYAPGVYVYGGFQMRDIKFKVKDGHIFHAEAAEGNEYLQEILSRGVGARYFGECAIGTNRGLSRRLSNPLLVEKTAGSFHITPGRCYTFTEYEGQKVMVNNGNKDTTIHWDITVLMTPQYGGGQILLDGEVIQQDGHFIDPALEILNPPAR